MKKRTGLIAASLGLAALVMVPGCATQRIAAVEDSLNRLERDLYTLKKADTEVNIKLDQVSTQVELLARRVTESEERVSLVLGKVSDLSAGGELAAPARRSPATERARDEAPPVTAPPAIEESMAMPPTAETPPATATPPAENADPELPAKTHGGGPEELYHEAYAAFTAAQYPNAILLFEEFMARFSQNPYADNARYWIGEAYYAQRDFRNAVPQFQSVVSDYPGGNKVPDAIVKLGFSYYELQEYEKAVAELQQVIEKFPHSAAADKARQKLALIESER
ncbi:MAG: tol-pal system protein YbgF [Candidatus Schekmanbacteria bacterium]|nr:tol-pal system protein YbgF [Candidatus Schekmanbacteria bacterium]